MNLKTIASKYKIAIMALQEVRWKGNGIIQSGDYTLFYSGGEDHTLGTGFLAEKRLKHIILHFKAIMHRCVLSD
jgi:hypothetical protein